MFTALACVLVNKFVSVTAPKLICHPGIEFPIIGAVKPEFVSGDEKFILNFCPFKPLNTGSILPMILLPVPLPRYTLFPTIETTLFVLIGETERIMLNVSDVAALVISYSIQLSAKLFPLTICTF